jgi:ATP-dependent Clp protease adaptor protein ClpS
MFQLSTQTQEETPVLVKKKTEERYDLVLYNDDVNTFDHVIQSLIEICKHDVIQAEQCTLLVHYKGKCGVKVGSYKELRPMCEAFLDRGISATIE